MFWFVMYLLACELRFLHELYRVTMLYSADDPCVLYSCTANTVDNKKNVALYFFRNLSHVEGVLANLANKCISKAYKLQR